MGDKWFGLIIMVVMVVGLVWWIVYTVRSEKKRDDSAKK
jgi:hypothetical protein